MIAFWYCVARSCRDAGVWDLRRPSVQVCGCDCPGHAFRPGRADGLPRGDSAPRALQLGSSAVSVARFLSRPPGVLNYILEVMAELSAAHRLCRMMSPSMHCCRSSQGKLGTRSVPVLNAAATVAAATVCRLNSPPDAVAAAAVTHELTTAAACWHVGGVACWRLRLLHHHLCRASRWLRSSCWLTCGSTGCLSCYSRRASCQRTTVWRYVLLLREHHCISSCVHVVARDRSGCD